ncbi:translation initiation factor IF-3 [Bernardetia sp. ABR2-2B]|uniref:translation initiation factor IF-3 n=1 Tax=Bernardetia sp. ABR2-2B TaxID=3127472 RepID=UPI0030D245C5
MIIHLQFITYNSTVFKKAHFLYSNYSLNKEVTIAKTYRRGGRRPIRREEDPHRINRRIRAKEIRIVGDDVENGIYSTADALEIAQKLGLDLVEIAPNGTPPVCKIIDYSKFKYEQKKKQKELKANAHKVVVKEIRFGPNTNEHDLDFKTKHAQKFLEEGNKVKAYVQFAGRTIVFKDRGREILDRFAEAVEEYGKPEGYPKMEGKRMIIMFTPKNIPKPKKKSDSNKSSKSKSDKPTGKSKDTESKKTDAKGTENKDSKKEEKASVKKAPTAKKASPKKKSNEEEE